MPEPKPYTATDGTVTWRVRFRLGPKSTSETFETREAAALFCREITSFGAKRAVQERNKRDHNSDDYIPTLREWYATAMQAKSGITDGTRADYDRLANRVMLPMLGGYHLDQIDRTVDAAFIKRLEHTPKLNNRGNAITRKGEAGGYLSPKTISTHHGLLSDLMNLAVIEGHITANPCRGARLPRAGEQHRRGERFLSHPEWNALHAALPDRHKALPFFLIGTGLRWSEATALQVRNVHLDLGMVWVVQAWKRPKKGGTRELGPPKSMKSRRPVVLGDQIIEALRPLVKDQPPDAFVFRSSTGGALWHSSYYEKVWTPACEKAGLTPRPRLHDLRHSHASWLIEAGVTLEQVQDQLGHESILTTRKVYGHLQPAMRAKLQAAATAALAWDAPKAIEGPPTPDA